MFLRHSQTETEEGPIPGGGSRRLLEGLGQMELAVASLALVGISILTGAGIFTRYVLNMSILWSEEVSLLLTNLMVFAGAAAMYKARTYVVLNYFYRKVSPAAQRGLSLLTWSLAAGFSALVTFYGLSLYPLQINTTSFVLQWPRFYWSLPLIWFGASTALTSLYYLWVELRWTDPTMAPDAREAAATLIKDLEVST